MNRAERRRQKREKCSFPHYFNTDRCCMCGGYVRYCPCTVEMAIVHSEKFHGLDEVRAGQARFMSRLQDPGTVVHADTEGGEKTACGLEIDFDMIVGSSEFANCPACQGTST